MGNTGKYGSRYCKVSSGEESRIAASESNPDASMNRDRILFISETGVYLIALYRTYSTVKSRLSNGRSWSACSPNSVAGWTHT